MGEVFATSAAKTTLLRIKATRRGGPRDGPSEWLAHYPDLQRANRIQDCGVALAPSCRVNHPDVRSLWRHLLTPRIRQDAPPRAPWPSCAGARNRRCPGVGLAERALEVPKRLVGLAISLGAGDADVLEHPIVKLREQGTRPAAMPGLPQQRSEGPDGFCARPGTLPGASRPDRRGTRGDQQARHGRRHNVAPQASWSMEQRINSCS